MRMALSFRCVGMPSATPFVHVNKGGKARPTFVAARDRCTGSPWQREKRQSPRARCRRKEELRC